LFLGALTRLKLRLLQELLLQLRDLVRMHLVSRSGLVGGFLGFDRLEGAFALNSPVNFRRIRLLRLVGVIFHVVSLNYWF
jgi:hypothetical protein